MLESLRRLFLWGGEPPEVGDGPVRLASTARSPWMISERATPRLRGCDNFRSVSSRWDRCYVINCHVDRVNAGLCETIIELARRFGLKTVAEGIETPHESHKLQGIGCDIGQGYLFGKPMPKAQLIGIIRRLLMEHSARRAASRR